MKWINRHRTTDPPPGRRPKVRAQEVATKAVNNQFFSMTGHLHSSKHFFVVLDLGLERWAASHEMEKGNLKHIYDTYIYAYGYITTYIHIYLCLCIYVQIYLVCI